MTGTRPGKALPTSEERALDDYEKRIRAKVAAARADSRPGMTTEQLRQQLHNR